MKTLLMTDPSLGLASGYMAKQILAAAAGKAGLTLVENPAEAELVIALGDRMPTDSALNGKAVWQGDAARAARSAGVPCARQSGSEPAGARRRADRRAGERGRLDRREARGGDYRLSDRRGAHLYGRRSDRNRSEKRGWWVKVETRGSVGAATRSPAGSGGSGSGDRRDRYRSGSGEIRR